MDFSQPEFFLLVLLVPLMITAAVIATRARGRAWKRLVAARLRGVLVSSGFQPGDRVCSSPLAVAVDGMLVRVVSPRSSLHPTTVAEVRSGS